MYMDKRTKVVAELREWVKSKSVLEYDKVSYLPAINFIEDLVQVRWNAETQSWEEIIYNF